MSITKGLPVILVAWVLATTSCTGSSDRPTAFVGRWTMDTDMYVESLREQQEKLAARAIEGYTKILGSEEAAREQVQKQQEQQLDRARHRALRFDLGADGTFAGRSSWKGPSSPQDYQGRWIVWPKGVILFDTEVVPSALNEPSPALGWILAMESGSPTTMRLHAGRLGSIFDPGLGFARADRSATGKIDVPVASPGADSGFVGTWRYDTKTKVEQLEGIQKRVGGESKAGDNLVESIAGSRLDLTLNADGSYVLEALLPEPDGEQKHTRQSGAWYRAGDLVVCIADLESRYSPTEPPHRAAFVLRHASGGGFEHVAGIMPLLNAQPPVPLRPVV